MDNFPVVEKGREEFVKKYIRENLLIISILSFAIVVRLYYFIKVGEQPIWWDEGDYLVLAKIWALDLPKPDWYGHFTGLRPLLYPIVMSAFFKMGLGEMAIRFFTLLLPSLGTVYLTYLVGKSMYNKNVGAMAAVMIGTYWVFLFYTYRVLTDIPSVFLGLISIYFFWEHYINRKKPKGLYLAMFFGVLAFSVRFPMALISVTFALFLLIVKKFSVVRDKTIWKGIGLTLILLAPYLIYFIMTDFYALNFYFVSGETITQPIDWPVISFFFSLPFSFFGIAFAIGLVSMYSLILYSDVIWKQKVTKFNQDVFLILFLLVHLSFYVVMIREATDRWLLVMMPVMFIVAGKGLYWIYSFGSKYNKIVALGIVGIILLGGTYQNLSHSDQLIEIKKDTYLEIKLAGEWLKENTPPDTVIVTSSIVQSQYYSERANYGHSTPSTRIPEETGCVIYADTNANESCQKLSEELFEKARVEIGADYFIASMFEPVFTPEWVYTYCQRKNLTVVQGYTSPANSNQPTLIICKL